MKKSILPFALLAFISIAIFAFKPISNSPKRTLNPGAYHGSDKITLTINADGTFSYSNHTNTNKLIDITGNWQLDGKNLSLINYESQQKVNDQWTIDENEKCLKSRRGMEWLRICLDN